MAIFTSIFTCVLTGAFVGAIFALPFWCAFQDFTWEDADSDERRGAAIKMAVYAIIVVAAVVCTGWTTYNDASRQEADPEGYAIEQAQKEEGYYRVVALEDGGVRIVEDPNTGGLYVRRKTGSNRSRAVELAPLLNRDGTPMTVEDWEEVKEK